MRENPHLYEINTNLFLKRISRKYEKNLTLATIPDDEWKALADKGFDYVWLMGVWQRSVKARELAQCNVDLRKHLNNIVPECTDTDVEGSAYAIEGYVLDKELGEKSDLATVRENLKKQGLSLILDFIPNHLARDNPWMTSHPDWFVQGDNACVYNNPERFFSPDGKINFAHGRDPYFPPWGDTVQVNFFSLEMRKALIGELLKIAEVADGVRCDMAMLALNDIFRHVWIDAIKGYPKPSTEFWAEAIIEVKRKHPNFLFIAEVYWGLGLKMIKLGFDYVYDKTLYDRLKFSTPAEIASYIIKPDMPLEHGMHFIENHDEPRAPVYFGRQHSLAAAVVISTIPGLRFFHDGQLEGKLIHIPVQLAKEPIEDVDSDIQQFYRRLLEIINTPAFHSADWKMVDINCSWQDNESFKNLLAWRWYSPEGLKIIVVNYSPNQSQGRIKLGITLKITEPVDYRDELTNAEYQGNPAEINEQGLYVDLKPWQAHILDLPTT
jgi:hypothetical protein